MLKNIDHIGIAVHSLENVKTFFLNIFGISPEFEETVAEQQVKVIGYRVGESNIEFLQPISQMSPISKYLEKRGEGLHHIAVAVEDLESVLASLKSKEIPLIDETPRTGAEGKKIAFVHPKGLFGILLELSQKNEKSNHSSQS
ncbi:MAG: methylmalonyl-CoA epimerase [bacterium]|nr:MAG: methylmalonyl-CoA epimerase [bacterium]